jgi:hypothetical protein
MTPIRDNYFLSTISHLRKQEEMLIYDRFISPAAKEEKAVADLLREEYAKEVLNFPGAAPAFEGDAAVWAARIVFNASQLLLSREKDAQDIVELLSPYSGAMTPAAILSADLCLRCLPDVIEKAREINPDDPLIGLLEDLLPVWHYSGIGYFRLPGSTELSSAEDSTELGSAEDSVGVDSAVGGGEFDFSPILADDCLRLLYIDRVIERRVAALANLPELRPGILAVMGDHGDFFWKEL